MESNQQSDENYEEFREERSPSGRKVFIRTTKTQKSITTSSSGGSASPVLQSITDTTTSSTPVPIPRRRHRNESSSSSTFGQVVPGEQQQQERPLLSPPGVCSNITTIVFHENEPGIDSAANFASLESLAREREETPGGDIVRSRTTTTTTVHHRTVTHLNQSSLHSTPSASASSSQNVRGRPKTIHMHSSDNDSLLEDNGSVAEESATFQNIHKFTSTHESTPLSSPISSHYGQDRFTSGDSLYRSAVFYSASPSMGSPLSGGSHTQHGLETDEWKFSRTHQFQTKSGFYRSISQYDSHIKEIRGEKERGYCCGCGNFVGSLT